jgi:type IV secretion system protein VirB8
VAVIHFRYSNEPMSLEDRFVNPLGFQVTGYRKDPEAAPPAAASPVAPPPTNAAPAVSYYSPPGAPPQQSGPVR